MPTPAPDLDRVPRVRAWAAALLAYSLIAAAYTHPLLRDAATHVAGNAGDPILNTTVLWWNAAVLPFTSAWWSPPYFHPAVWVSAFTENLTGLYPIASPLAWLTSNPLTTYNVTLFLCWPLSATAMFVLLGAMIGRRDAAFVGGLAFGFSPYRTAELGHLQMVASFWIPIILLALHAYLTTGRRRWLAIFAACWILQSLANLYMLLFAGVLVAVWLAYFGLRRGLVRRTVTLSAVWILASASLGPVLLKYQAVHDHYALRRTPDQFKFSAPPRAFAEVSGVVALWRHVLPDGRDNLFPGVVAPMIVAAAVHAARRRRRGDPATGGARRRRWLDVALAAGALLSLGVIVVTLAVGPWRIELSQIVLRVTFVDRALLVLAICAGSLLARSRHLRDALRRRDALIFYTGGVLLFACLSLGPVLRNETHVLYDGLPYSWLLPIPGFSGLRVPTRFWMLGVLCLSAAAAIGFARLTAASTARRRRAIAAVLSAALLIDSWMSGLRMAAAPEEWAVVEPRDRTAPILELPIGPDFDPGATYRSSWHRRRVFNGVSGYDPPHYEPLLDRLEARDPEILRAMAALGAFDVVVDGASDPDGAWLAFIASAPGAVRTATDGTRTVFAFPEDRAWHQRVGDPLEVRAVSASVEGAERLIDNRADTDIIETPQRPGQWIVLELATTSEVGGVSYALGQYARDFPRRLAIDLSLDGTTWTRVWEAGTGALAFHAATVAPRDATLQIPFTPARARFVRFAQLAHHRKPWQVSDVRAHAPERGR